MRTLKFDVNHQHIQKERSCDFNGLVTGSRGYLRAEFTFSPDWAGCAKAASFWVGNVEHSMLLENNACMIPDEVAQETVFYVEVTGKRDKMLFATDRVKVEQKARGT